jgi:hypothetical protein
MGKEMGQVFGPLEQLPTRERLIRMARGTQPESKTLRWTRKIEERIALQSGQVADFKNRSPYNRSAA